MGFAKKAVFSGILIIGTFVAGFLFLLRGCLSKYDERSANAGILYFRKGNQQVVFSIVKFDKATSYSSSQGMTRKTVSTTYYLQINDGITGQKLAQKKIIHQSDIKNHPVEILGGRDDIAWVFINELMAFDPFTLRRVAGVEELGQKNPVLNNKFPAERRFYVFDPLSGSVRITAKDGSRWSVNAKTFLATPYDEVNEKESGTKKLAALLEKNSRDHDTLYHHLVAIPSRQMSAGIISRAEYNRRYDQFNLQRRKLYNDRDSLRYLISQVESVQRSKDELERRVRDLSGKNNISFSQIKSNADTIGGEWLGLYSKREMEKLYDRFRYEPVYDEAARRQIFVSSVSQSRNGEVMISLAQARSQGSSYFLDGGFLLDKNTAMPVHYHHTNLVVHKSEIGGEGTILLTALDRSGETLWTFDTQLKELANYIYTGEGMIITGRNNKELSSGSCNILWTIDLATGKASAYDYFLDH